ncbi:MAG TPA: GspH/FimT family pseudopilin [Cellvibrio sp.]|nr:GspH/FimT family pseudopilin [Cellvibrio sp.]
MSKNQKAFTLIELLITITVLFIVLTIGLPNLTGQIASNRSSALSSEMLVAVNFARDEAIHRSARISICPSIDGASCASATDWNKGWIVFLDTAASDSVTTYVVGTVLRYWNDLNKDAVVTVMAGSTAVDFVRFTSSGALGSTVATGRTINTYLAKCKGLNQSVTNIGIAGMIRSSKIACPL